MKAIDTEIKLLESMCDESCYRDGLWDNTTWTKEQLSVIKGYLEPLNISFAQMMENGYNHSFGKGNDLLADIVINFQLTIEDLFHKLIGEVSEEAADEIKDKLHLDNLTHDRSYFTSVSGSKVDLDKLHNVIDFYIFSEETEVGEDVFFELFGEKLKDPSDEEIDQFLFKHLKRVAAELFEESVEPKAEV